MAWHSPSFSVAFVVFFLFLSLHLVHSYHFLAISVTGKSHLQQMKPILSALEHGGHSVTLVSAFEYKGDLQEIILLQDIGERNMEMMDNAETDSPQKLLNLFKKFVDSTFEALDDNRTAHIFKTYVKPNYDAVLVTEFFSESFYAFAHKWNLPLISIAPSAGMPQSLAAMGQPFIASWMPFMMSTNQSPRMNYLERTMNLVYHTVHNIAWQIVFVPYINERNREFFGNSIPCLNELQREVDLEITMSHFALSGHPRPLLPNVIDVGCLNCAAEASKSIPREFEDLISSAGEAGFIYFSFGTTWSAKFNNLLTKEQLLNILGIFGQLKQAVFWKMERDDVGSDEVPSNVHLGKWFPQAELLNDVRLRFFITHGGLNSVQEALYFGAPMLAIPLGGDQFVAAHKIRDLLGVGDYLTFDDFAAGDIFNEKINKLLIDKELKSRGAEIRKRILDVPVKPIDLAVFWVEYAVRHKGADFMKCEGRFLNRLQYYSLDVILPLICLILLIVVSILRCCLRCCWRIKEKVD